MAGIPIPAYQAFWTNARVTIKSEIRKLIDQHPDAEEQLRLLYEVLCDIEDVAGYNPTSVGKSQEWASIFTTVEENRANYCEELVAVPLCCLLTRGVDFSLRCAPTNSWVLGFVA
jgi:hypothetical protein